MNIDRDEVIDEIRSANNFEKLENKTDYLVDTIDKLNKRLSDMGRIMMEYHNKTVSSIAENVKPTPYIVKETKSAEIGNLSAALSKAQKEFGPIMQANSSFKGKFGSLSDIQSVTVPALEKHELATVCLLGTNEFGDYILTLTLTHSSGQWIETSALLKDEQVGAGTTFHQRIGSAEKILRRYMYRSMLCLAEEKED